MEKNKRDFFFGIAAVAVFLLVFLSVLISAEVRFKRAELHRDFFGQVLQRYNDSNNRNEATIVVGGYQQVLYSQDLYSSIAIGDTILKKQGSFKYRLVKHGDTSEYYPNDLFGGQLTDN